MGLDKVLIEKCCKRALLDIVTDSQHIRKTLSFPEHVKMLEWVSNLNYQESVSAVFYNCEPLTEIGIRDFENKFRKFLKYSLAAIAGGVLTMGAPTTFGVAPTVAMLLYYLFRKATDPCWQTCLKKFGRPLERKACKYECQATAAENIVKNIKAQISRCKNTRKPLACERKLNKEYTKWSMKLQTQLVKLQKARADLIDSRKPKIPERTRG